MSYVLVGLIAFWAGIGSAYLFTHPELRAALFSRLHKGADAAFQKIAAAVEKKKGPAPLNPPGA